ncbi:site-specific DNA-methyltransferase [Chryseobacterium taklimakanense]|uniref:DNA methyltransferase n=1 Tax=Chryseobacterium taklimakanense TaxID=536441 RepID=UPI001EF50857|nr:DNA methyltransferase [Chryseobacterium taklimakanense]MCG7281998.1 site-specific DNA-methyltransferase [Chryseobacterium taklimakanense]
MLTIDLENFITPWAKQNAREYDSWHSMCSYLGAFPAPLANYFIKYFTKKGDIVFDPFSGRGTTALEARIQDRKSIATDLNPIALALSRAKNASLTKEEIFARIAELERKYDSSLYQQEAKAQPEEIHLIFHPRTLAQLCYLKRKLLKSEKPIDQYLIGISLGTLHGGERANGTSGYASIDMPNTFSMSPDYVRKFVQTNNLNRIFHDMFTILREKTERLYKKHSGLKQSGVVVKADAKKLSKVDELKPFHKKVSLILTSPPYLGVVNYAKQNWIRSWFLDEDPLKVSEELDDDLNLEEWINFSKVVIVELKKFLKKDGVAVFVIGDVAKSKTSVIPLAREFALMIREEKLFKNVWCINDAISDTDKTTRIWADSKGKATATDRVIFLSDINPFEKFANNDEVNRLDFDFVEASTKYFIG